MPVSVGEIICNLQYLTAPQDKFGVYPYTLTKSGGRGHGRVQVMTGHETTIRNNSGGATHCTLASTYA